MAVTALAVGDPAAAWYATVSSATSAFTWRAAPEVVAEIYGPHPAAMLAGSSRPATQAEPDGEALRLSGGQWEWGSGGVDADWFVAALRVRGRSPVSVLLPRDRVNVGHDWDAVGLRASASNSFAVTDGTSVPGRHVLDGQAAQPGLADCALACYPRVAYEAGCFAAVALGNAHGALADFVDLAQSKVAVGASAVLAESPLAQSGLARATARLLAAEALLHQTVNSMWDGVRAGCPAAIPDRLRARLAMTHAATEARQTVNLMFELGGSTAARTSSPLQKRMRDAAVIAQHFHLSGRHAGLYGAHRLGRELTNDDLMFT
jgi:alkylation response protein AidB-like acyl-CoA dehydrogenase